MIVVGRLKWLVFGEFETQNEEDIGPIARLAIAIRSSLLRFAVFLGLVMIASGLAIDAAVGDQGTVAAMLVIWGVSSVLYGLLGFLVVILIGY